MNRHALTVITCLALFGCAASNPGVEAYRSYVSANKPLAEQGKVKWSQYYEGAYSVALSGRPMPPATFLNALSGLIAAAQDYEAGRITLEQFQGARRQAQISVAADAQAEAQARQQAADATATAIGLQLLQISQPRPAQPTVINCTTVRNGQFLNTNCQ